MKSELFQLDEISTLEAMLFLQVCKEDGMTAKGTLNTLTIIDELLAFEKTKMFLNTRKVDRKRNKEMYEKIIEKYMNGL